MVKNRLMWVVLALAVVSCLALNFLTGPEFIATFPKAPKLFSLMSYFFFAFFAFLWAKSIYQGSPIPFKKMSSAFFKVDKIAGTYLYVNDKAGGTYSEDVYVIDFGGVVMNQFGISSGDNLQKLKDKKLGHILIRVTEIPLSEKEKLYGTKGNKPYKGELVFSAK